MSYWMKREFRGNFIRMLGSILLLGAFKSLKSQMDPEIYGGAPLLGVPGAVIITHGSSSHKAIYHAIRVGVLAAKNDMTGEISRRIAEYEQSENIDPYKVKDLLKVHKLMMGGLVDEAGLWGVIKDKIL